MNAERILAMADYMERLDDPKTYYQGAWMSRADEPDETEVPLDAIVVEDKEHDGYWRKVTINEGACSTAMCVLGHGVTALPDAGLFFAMGKGMVEYSQENGRYELDDVTVAIDLGDMTATGFSAGKIAFDIPYQHASILFGGSSDRLTNAFYTDRTRDEVWPRLCAATSRPMGPAPRA